MYTGGMPTIIDCNVVLVPSMELTDRAVALSNQLQSRGTLFCLEQGRFDPHVSLYMLPLRDTDLPSARERLESVVGTLTLLTLSAHRYYKSRGYFDAEYVRTDTLDGLQMTIVEALNPLRQGMRDNDTHKLDSVTGAMRQSLEMYGYGYVGETFRPHLTLTRFMDDTEIDTADLPPVASFDGTYGALALYRLGENGTCTLELMRLPFNT
jgi:hypothetical protein